MGLLLLSRLPAWQVLGALSPLRSAHQGRLGLQERWESSGRRGSQAVMVFRA